MFRFWCLLTGYLFGNILTAEIIARARLKTSAFEIGSGNPGAANITKQAGLPWGAAVLAGDLIKVVAAAFLCRFLFFPNESATLCYAWTGLGCTIGHNMPVWHRFNGGKGVATTCASLFLISPLWGTAAMLIGLAAVKIGKSLALGGILIPAVFVPFAALFCGREVTAVALILTAFMIWRFLRGRMAKSKK